MPRYGSASRADSPCFGRTDSNCDSMPDLQKWDLDMAGDYRLHVPSHLFHPRLLLQELILVRVHQIRLALFQECRKHRTRHRDDPSHRQLLTEECPSMYLPQNPQNNFCLSATSTLTWANTALTSSALAAFWFRIQQKKAHQPSPGRWTPRSDFVVRGSC